jgi:hypothetical protein
VTAILNQPGNTDKLVASATSWDKAYSAFMEMQARSTGAPRWVNHAPKDVFYVSELAKAFPTSQFVFCIRDPRDFMLSYKYKWRVTGKANIARMKSLYNPILTALLWRASARLILKHVGSLAPARAMILRYEDLVERPTEMGERLYAFVGEKFRSDYLNVGFSNSSHDQSNGGISNSSVGRWAAALAESEAWWAERITRRELAAFDYKRSNASIGSLKCLADFVHTPFALYRALAANREYTGPLLPYLTRRLASLLGR